MHASEQHWFRPALAASAFVLVVAACEGKKTPAGPATPDASAAAAPAATPSQALPAPLGSRWPKPSGPQFAILAGQGVGPIRLRAKVSTVERHMQLPCSERAPGVCRYLGRGVEFHLDQEERVTRIWIHRVGRKVESGAFGIFNGAIPPDLQMGMLPEAVQQHMGKPKNLVQGDAGGHPGTIEQHEYDGIVLEYDRMPSGQLVLSGMRIPK